jgi:hypothetical protein
MANRIHLITSYIEKRKSGVGVARLIMMSGVNVRGYGPHDPEPADVLERVQQVLTQLLSPQELKDLVRLLAEENT